MFKEQLLALRVTGRLTIAFNLPYAPKAKLFCRQELSADELEIPDSPIRRLYQSRAQQGLSFIPGRYKATNYDTARLSLNVA